MHLVRRLNKVHLLESLWFYRPMQRAVWLLIAATSLYSVINVGVKWLEHLPASQIVVFRAGISAVICSFFIWKKGASFWGNNIKVLFLRGFLGTIALLSLFTCLQKVPLAVGMTLINLSPIFTVIIAHFYLKEKANLSQWVFLVFSFLGVVMVRGEVQPVPWIWMLLGIGAALFAAMAYTCVRHLRTTEDPLVVILYFPLITIPMVSPIMAYQWETPQGYDWLILLGIGSLTQVAQYCMTLAYQLEAAAKVMVFNYAGLFWGVLLGWLIFNEKLSYLQICGVLLVFFCLCGNYLVSKRPLKMRRKV